MHRLFLGEGGRQARSWLECRERASRGRICHNRDMPLFEYACRDCGHQFEYLTRAGQTPSCPSCSSEALEKQLSVFAVSAGPRATTSTPAGPCGTCGDPRGPGSCSLN